MYLFFFAGRCSLRFLGRIDFKVSTAGGPFVFFQPHETPSDFTLCQVTPRPNNASEGGGNLVYPTKHTLGHLRFFSTRQLVLGIDRGTPAIAG